MTDAFIEHLRELRRRDDRGALSGLRRGLSGDAKTRVAMHSHVLPYLPRGTRRWREECAYAVAALFAFHGGPEEAGISLGRAVRRIVGAGGENEASIESRFVALLRAHSDDLLVNLRQVVSLLKSREVPLDWELLLRHLSHWDDADEWVQRGWARDFWGSPQQRAEETSVSDEQQENTQ